MSGVIDETVDVTSQINTLSETIFKFGVSTVIVAVGIVIFIIIMVAMFRNSQKQFQSMSDSNKELMNSMLDQNERLISSIIESKTNTTKPCLTDNEPHLVEAFIDIGIGIKSICKSMLLKLNCARVAVYVFHNGNNSAHGLPFFKMSCIGEWAKRNVGNMGSKQQCDFPLYVFSDLVESLYDNGEFIVSNIENLPEDSNLKDFVGIGTKSLSAFSIIDEKGNLAGFTIVEFKEPREFETPKVLNEVRSIVVDNNKTIGNIIIDSEIEDRIRGN